MTNTIGFYEGIPVYIATWKYQRRKHRKKRINKKWRKRYGVIEYNTMPHGQVIYNEFDRVMYMTEKTFEEIKRSGKVREQND